jgi:hypothetical protein
VRVCVSVSLSVSWTLLTFTELTLRIHRAEIFNWFTFLFLCAVIEEDFIAKYCYCISKRLSKSFFIKLKLDITLSKTFYLYRVAQKSLDTVLVLLNIECQVTLAPPCIRFIGIYYAIHVSGLRTRRYRISSCAHLRRITDLHVRGLNPVPSTHTTRMLTIEPRLSACRPLSPTLQDTVRWTRDAACVGEMRSSCSMSVWQPEEKRVWESDIKTDHE